MRARHDRLSLVECAKSSIRFDVIYNPNLSTSFNDSNYVQQKDEPKAQRDVADDSRLLG